MSDEPQDPWVWQGFYGPLEAATAAKTTIDALPPEVVGARVPLAGEAPVSVDEDEEDWMFAIQTRPDNQVAVPQGMKRARRALVGRLIGA